MKSPRETAPHLREIIIPEEYKDFLKNIILSKMQELTDPSWINTQRFFNALQIRTEFGNITTKAFTEDWDSWIQLWKHTCSPESRTNSVTLPRVDLVRFEEFIQTLKTLGIYEGVESVNTQISQKVGDILSNSDKK